MKVATHQLRCTECASVITKDEVSSNFRCPQCNGLYEVVYPWSDFKPDSKPGATTTPTPGAPGHPTSLLPNPSALRWLWQERRTSTMAIDQSGVWRFRDLLPIVDDLENVVTLREGNTPLYELPRCAEAAGVDWLLAKHQGMNPTGSFKDTGMTAALSVAAERGFKWVACASTGNTSAAMAAYAARAGLRSHRLHPRRQDRLGQALAVDGLRRPHHPAQDRLRRLRPPPHRTRPPLPHLPPQLRQPLSPRRPEDPRLRDRRAAGLAGSRAHRRPRRQSRQLLRARQRLPGDEAPRPHPAHAQDQHHPGRGRQPALPLVQRHQPR